jgi:hypothetical protein
VNNSTNIDTPIEEIQLSDNTQYFNDQRKEVLNSPSLENLNNQAESS